MRERSGKPGRIKCDIIDSVGYPNSLMLISYYFPYRMVPCYSILCVLGRMKITYLLIYSYYSMYYRYLNINYNLKPFTAWINWILYILHDDNLKLYNKTVNEHFSLSIMYLKLRYKLIVQSRMEFYFLNPSWLFINNLIK